MMLVSWYKKVNNSPLGLDDHAILNQQPRSFTPTPVPLKNAATQGFYPNCKNYYTHLPKTPKTPTLPQKPQTTAMWWRPQIWGFVPYPVILK